MDIPSHMTTIFNNQLECTVSVWYNYALLNNLMTSEPGFDLSKNEDKYKQS